MFPKLRKSLWHLSNPFVFRTLFNVRNYLKKCDSFVTFDKSKDLFCIKSKSQLRYATTTTRSLLYIDGFEKRAFDLYSKYMLDLVDLPKGALVVDCGANMGDFRLALNLKGQGFRYYGVEASPRDYIALRRNSLPEDEVLNLALHDRDDNHLTFYIDSKTASSSSIKPKRIEEIVEIPARRLSSLIPNSKIDLLKLEAEGAEPEVLRGCVGILGNIQYISADVGPERGISEEETRDEVIKFLLSHGFKVLSENRPKNTILFKKS